MKVAPLFCVLALISAVQAEELSVWPPHWMCAEAPGILLGERVGANKVQVLEWLLRPANGEFTDDEIEIKGLDRHSRVVRAGFGFPGQEGSKNLRSQRLVCFLENKGGFWHSMSAVGEGSSGLIWIENGRCFRYEQLENPGPLDLVAYRRYSREADLRKAIAGGLADRRAWSAAQKIAHPQEKAVVLASYLLARTSPEGDHVTYRQRVRQVLPKLGRDAVRELIELLRNAEPDDRLGDAVLVLYDLGPAAQAAVPELVGLLNRPAQVNPARVIEALGRIGDASVAPKILPLLDDGELQVRAEAASAMARFRYQDAAPQIGRALPELRGLRQPDAYYVYTMLRALHELDPKLTPRLARKYVDHPAMKEVRDLLGPFLANKEG